ncbi:hypothetical protein [Mucilaginibacter sp.]|uniref:hypothetical protein n=1 Tax=Mucilaginibacter sp. TaxID=1882438 RepID=UPI0025DB21D1|nr:hypothetical protein [Mucilaginibacter sp.]
MESAALTGYLIVSGVMMFVGILLTRMIFSIPAVMKKYLFLLTIAMLPFLAKSQELARKKCISSLLKAMNDPGSYKPVSWTKLKKEYSDYYSSERHSELDLEKRKYEALNDKVDHLIFVDKIGKRDEELLNNDDYHEHMSLKAGGEIIIDSLKKLDSVLSVKFSPKLQGYSLVHTFRAKNKFGALVLSRYYFFIDTRFKVVEMEDENERDRKRREIIDMVNQATEKYRNQ